MQTGEASINGNVSSEPDSPGRRELLRHIAANFPALAFHAFGRLPDGIGDKEIWRLSKDIEETAFAAASDIHDPAVRKQAYYKEASKGLLETVLDHCPPDADPTVCLTLAPPVLEPPSSLTPHVIRPPMDPRFNATSPFAGHTGEPTTPSRFAPPFLAAGDESGHKCDSESNSSSKAHARRGSMDSHASQQRSPSLEYMAARAHARNASVMGSSSTSAASSRAKSIQRQMSSTLRQDSGLLPLSLGSLGRSSSVWGWLEAASEDLQPVLLKGAGVAIGRSREGFEARRHALSVATSESGAIQDPSPARRLAEVSAMALGFVEVADGRVSRLHCMIRADPVTGLPLMNRLTAPVMLEDQSANGTFVNGERLPKGERLALRDGDRVSLILSLSPMVEKSFVFRLGDPRHKQEMAEADWAETSPPSQLAVPEADDAVDKSGPRLTSMQSSRRGLKRTATSRYTTADSSEPGDMMCQICLGPLRSCLALQPCGHNFCAPCLSHHLASLLQSGQALNCPLRCASPARVVANPTMRRLVAANFPPPRQHQRLASGIGIGESGRKCSTSELHPDARTRATSAEDMASIENLPWQTFDRARFERDKNAAAGIQQRSSTADTELLDGQPPWEGRGEEEEAGEEEDTDAEGSDDGEGHAGEGALTEMSSLCPLWDDMLPLDASNLKTKQVEFALRDLQQSDLDKLMSALEVLARLAWSDDEVRTAIAMGAGIEAVVALMRKWIEEPGLLCNACLCLMSLVRGEGPACEANQWQVAKAGGVEAVVSCMTSFADNALVQLSALLCLIPLALDNSSLQAHVATLALPAVVASLRAHSHHADVQAKGLVVLGVLGQGEEAVHDAIRQQQLAVGATGRILEAVRQWNAENEEILWAVLFSLAVLVRDGANPFQPAIRAVAAAGIPPLLATHEDFGTGASTDNSGALWDGWLGHGPHRRRLCLLGMEKCKPIAHKQGRPVEIIGQHMLLTTTYGGPPNFSIVLTSECHPALTYIPHSSAEWE